MKKKSSAKPKRSAIFHNREWSWLRFNERVLEEAEDPSNPLVERLKFLGIFGSNLDEFFMVRVAGLYRQLDAGIRKSGTDARSPRRQLNGIAELVHELIPRQEKVLTSLWKELAEAGIRVVAKDALDPPGQKYLDRYYEEVVYPVITPMVVGPTHPFPTLHNCTLFLALRLEQKKKPKKKLIAFVGLPHVLPRFVSPDPSGAEVRLVPLESLIASRMPELFAGYRIPSLSRLRVTRDAEFIIDEEAAEDFRKAMARKILGRRHGAAVRLEFSHDIDEQVLDKVQRRLAVDTIQHYRHKGLIQARDLMQLGGLVDRPELKFAPRRALSPPGEYQGDIFQWMQKRPRLVHLPYHTFEPVAQLAIQAADDPEVLAIKQTLYRTSGKSPVVRALTRAAEKGKHVTAVVELRARFEEQRNIEWAHRLEQAGAHVVYGLVGFKTHCKVLLVVRREPEGIRRYVHFGTGNYNDATARLYTDVGLMTCDDRFGEDASALFNMITGATLAPRWNKVEVAPSGLRRRLVRLIEREVGRSARRRRGRIVAKMNSLVDREMIEALYAASQAGVKVELIVRGICCLQAGVPKLSENIRVVSIVGRYLEHPRIFYFYNGGKEELYISSADWMPRNLDHRVELMTPVEDPEHLKYLKDCMELQLKDDTKAREMEPAGTYRRVKRSKRKRISAQDAIYELTQKRLAEPESPANPDRFVPIHSENRLGSE